MNGSGDPLSADETTPEAARERRALIIALALVAIATAAGIWATLQPVETPAFYGARILTPLQVFNTLESHLQGPGCGVLLQGMQTKIEGQYAQVTLPALGVFEVHSHHFPSGLLTVRAIGPVSDRADCRFDGRYQGPNI
jgi:hypothetical protein